MYLEYFTLKRHPFRITPDPTLFFPGGGRGEILEALIYAITTGEGIVKVVGEVGSGKTMLCRLLEERLPKSIEIVYLANPSLSPHDILYAIAFELKLPVTVETERLMVMQQLHTYLLGQHSANRSVVVFIEEAQGMPVETLEEIRLLSNLETHQHKLLQIVLFGQPELEKNLRKRTIRQLKERITHSFHLEPLTTAEVGEYIRFRLQAAGCGKSGVFASGAERLIARASRGLIRRINILADKAMLASYADPDTGIQAGSTPMVRSRHVQAAIRDSEFDLPIFSRPAWLCAGVVFLVLISAAVFGWYRFDAAAFLPTLLTGNSTSLQSPPGQSRSETAPPKSDGPSTEMPTAARPDPEKPAGIDEGKSLLSTAGSAPTFVAERPVAPLASESEPTQFRAALTSPKSPIQSKEVEKATSAPSQRAVVKPEKNLMDMRRKATTQWLKNVHREDYTIQLMAVDSGNDTDMEKFFRQISPVSLLDRIYVCPVRRGEHDMWVVVFSEFQEASSARRALDVLPGELRQLQPFVRRLGELLRDSAQTNAHN
jgi:MSHA biogenesis protein MshM